MHKIRDSEPDHGVQTEGHIQKIEYKVYFQRWPLLLAYCCYSVSNAIPFVQTATITPQLAAYFGIEQNQVQWFPNMYYLAYFIFGGFVTGFMQWRLDVSVTGSCGLACLGCWMIYFGFDNLVCVLFGFLFNGLAQVVQLPAPIFIADKWFNAEERTIATSLGSFLNYIGYNFSFIFSAFYVSTTNQSDANFQIEVLNLIYACISTISFIACIMFIRDSPPTPPSFTANNAKESPWISTKKMYSRIKYILSFMTISIFIGVSWAYIVAITSILQPFNYTQGDIGFIGLTYQVLGLTGGVSASVYVDSQVTKGKKPNYDLFNRIFLTVGVLGVLLQALIIEYVGYGVNILLSAMIGFGINGFYPIAVQSYAESLYPSSELALVTMIMIGANLTGFVINQILTVPEFSTSGLWVLFIFLAPFYVYFMVFNKTKFNRFDTENKVVPEEVIEVIDTKKVRQDVFVPKEMPIVQDGDEDEGIIKAKTSEQQKQNLGRS